MPKKYYFKKLKKSWKKIINKLIIFGGISENNQIKIFSDGDELFKKIKANIDLAKHYIIIETYILANDAIGVFIRDALIKAKYRGVEVYLQYDYWGSAGLGASFLTPLQKAKINIKAYNPIWPWQRKGPFLRRNHRKMIIIDDEIAFCGGVNISKDYAGPDLGTGRFRDVMVKINGPAVLDLKSLALENIENIPNNFFLKIPIKRKKIQIYKFLFRRLFNPKHFIEKALKSKGIAIQVLQSNIKKNLLHIQKGMEICLSQAIEYCYFTSPYFLPYEILRKSMISAQKRGVDVRVLTAGLSDVPLMRMASQHVYGDFIKNGIKIYEMQKRTLHAKSATIDGLYSSVGSYNLDQWSARRNLEVNVSFFDKEVSKSLKEQFEEDLQDSIEITPEFLSQKSWINKLFCWFAYQIMRL